MAVLGRVAGRWLRGTGTTARTRKLVMFTLGNTRKEEALEVRHEPRSVLF